MLNEIKAARLSDFMEGDLRGSGRKLNHHENATIEFGANVMVERVIGVPVRAEQNAWIVADFFKEAAGETTLLSKDQALDGAKNSKCF